MRGMSKSVFGALCLLAAGCFVITPSAAQTIFDITDLSLKNGETLELGNSFLISTNCKSLLIAPLEVEIMDGPPGLTVNAQVSNVTPRGWSCAKPVRGAKVYLSANNIEDYSFTSFVLRFKFKTREGDRYRTHMYRVALFP